MIGGLHRWLESTHTSTPLSLSIYRLVFAGYVLLFLLPIGVTLPDQSPEVFVPPRGLASMFGGFPSAPWVIAANVVIGSLTTMLLLGWRTRVISIALSLALMIFFARAYSGGKINHNVLALIAPAAMAFTDWGARLSLDAARYAKRSADQQARAQLWSNRCLTLFALAIGMAMFYAGWSKLIHGWIDPGTSATLGHATLNVMASGREPILYEPMRQWLTPWMWELMDWFTLIFELGLLVAVLNRTAFRGGLAVAVAFHVGVIFIFSISFHANIVAYGAFVAWAALLPRAGDLPALGRLQPWPARRAAGTLIVALGVLSTLVIARQQDVASWVPGGAGAALVFVPASLIACGWVVIQACRLLGAADPSPTPELRPAAGNDDRLEPTQHPILFFDGQCGLCNAAVDFVIARDQDRRFRYAMLQGELARERLIGLDHDAPPDSLVLLDEAGVHDYSSAALRIALKLPAPWSWVRACLLIPYPLRDAVYRLIARHRYRFFGYKETCRMPTPEERALFVV